MSIDFRLCLKKNYIFHKFFLKSYILNYMKKIFYEFLRVELIFNGYTIKEFAGIIGIPYATMLTYLNKGSIPRADVAVRIAQVLHTSVEYLITGKNIETKKIVKHYPTAREILELEPEEQKILSELIHHLAENRTKEINDEKY